MTAQYSNAALVAVLPFVSDFAAKLNLSITRPITKQDVKRLAISPIKDQADMGIWLTNGYWFGLNHNGYIDAFRAPKNFFAEQGEDVTKYAGKDQMTTGEAVAMSRNILVSLGYKSESFHFKETPTLEGPSDTPQGYMPYCRVKWVWPKSKDYPNYIQFDINTETKKCVGMEIFVASTNNVPMRPLNIGIEPELEKDYQARTHAKIYYNTNAPQKYVPNNR